MFVESSSDDSDMDLEKVFWKKKDRTKSRSITIRKMNLLFKIFYGIIKCTSQMTLTMFVGVVALRYQCVDNGVPHLPLT